MSEPHFPLTAAEQAAIPAAPRAPGNWIIKGRDIVQDDWLVLRPSTEGSEGGGLDDPQHVVVPDGKVIVPFKVWQAQRAALSARPALGVWLAPDEMAEQLADDFDRFQVIAIDFPKFSDGRGYSTAYLLRTRLGYKGELRAIGDVLRDQLFYMMRAGFDAYATRPDRSIDDALKGLSDFSETYQAAWDREDPLFRRAHRAAVPESGDIGYGI
ncbi:MAG TPA: DUF934 domain-containing protein [Burkholderiaceae bacterium]